ncbi:hypothetical protein LEP1GSC047_4110 [Leptospira inadai serovar Lyme str. 10]|uniref:Uncharacterized protein n=2 Tax=Leptospira inadai serovar Lyme TaxID=293084 RepID=V6HES4_9LEPT|nr:hypothetical protein [Leptospira inadai]EQA37883.1 hypothetical protein LEP1GSC047_4110 [Leptospira inadai serovar Lyme str. 10]PNV73036.1 hypothetical protein BES34_018280 [Leptospira inadai serovar Lyme]
MQFEILPILDRMIELYHEPLNKDRFRKYLNLALNEEKTDVEIPQGRKKIIPGIRNRTREIERFK